MNTRIRKYLLVAVLGVILSVAVVPTAKAGEVKVGEATYTYPDVWLVSSPEIETPATIVLASSHPDVHIGNCAQGSKNPQGAGVLPVEYCQVYLVSRSGPDASGHYLSEWRLPMAQPGLLVELTPYVGHESIGQYTTFVLTVTGDRLGKYGDFRSCTQQNALNTNTLAQGYVAYYAEVSTTLTFQLQQKVRVSNRWRWKTVTRYKPQSFPVGGSKGLIPYGRRYAKTRPLYQRTLFPHPSQQSVSKYRLIYLIKQGKEVRPRSKLLKRGAVSKRPCTLVSHPVSGGGHYQPN